MTLPDKMGPANMVALIPARAGSRRIPHKNRRLLAGQPLIAYTLAAARQSQVFSEVWISTDDDEIVRWAVAQHVSVKRRAIETTDEAPDILWVREFFQDHPRTVPAFAILRPTAPFRTYATIRRAYDQFMRSEVHSLRAVEPATQHPGKMWWLENGCLVPVLSSLRPDRTPWHSSPTQTLPKVYRQNASLEMAWTYVVTSFGTISGTKIAPFFTEGLEGYDLNDEADWTEAERLIDAGLVALPTLAPV